MDALPLTAAEHEHSAAVDVAAEWLASHPAERAGKPLVPALRSRFGLTAPEAIEAIRQANLRHARAA